MTDTSASDADAEFEAELRRAGLRPDQTPQRLPIRVIKWSAVAAMVGFWFWAFSPWAPQHKVDQLDDPAFAEAAGPLCERAVAALEALPRATTVRTLDERADLLDQGTLIYRGLLTDLRGVAPDPATGDGAVVDAWLDDWGVYLADRDAYAADFRAGIDGPFEVTMKGPSQITKPIDAFAEQNGIDACSSPQDA